KAGKALGKAVKGPVGQKLGGFLKGAVKKVVPAAASVAGGLFGGPVGAAAAGKIASAATKAFGMELEGMSTEDQEFESARRFVRFAGEAARQASRLAGSTDPQDAAHKAVVGAAKRFAPGLVRPALRAMHGEVGPGPIARGNHSGRWVRQGEKIVLMGL
ncbi:MAG: hypothetical protein OEW22_09400, partial [Rubrivivax sp.]|nr:hypothetical protein [Rubrivivax sp.]